MVVMAVVNMGIHVCGCSGDHGYEALVRKDVPPIPFTKLRGEYNIILALVRYIVLYFIFTTPVLYLLHITS